MGKEAHVRAYARVLLNYYQVDYYASGVHETRKRHLEPIPYYNKILTQQEADDLPTRSRWEVIAAGKP